jgi:hypothetical protein
MLVLMNYDNGLASCKNMVVPFLVLGSVPFFD